MTILDLMTEALVTCNIIGESQPASDPQARVAFKCLTGLVDTANAAPLLQLTQSVSTFTLIPGQQAYTIGSDPSMNFNAPRFEDLLFANVINLSVPAYPIRSPMRILDYDGWAQISLQNSPTPIPTDIYYDAGYSPIGTTGLGYGTIRVHGVPSAANQLELWSTQPLTQASAYTDLFVFPPGYYEWMLYGLCIRLYPRFGRTPDATVVELFKNAQVAIESANALVPILKLDSGLPNGRPTYFDARTNRYIP